MKLPTYKEALKMGKEAVGELLVPVKANRAKKQAELELCKLDEKIAVKEAEVQTECTKEDLSFEKIIRLQDELGLLQRKQKQYLKILEQMFPTEEAA